MRGYGAPQVVFAVESMLDRESARQNAHHGYNSYATSCMQKKQVKNITQLNGTPLTDTNNSLA
ncbi:hypothetical protein G4A30_28670, partial [Escherichia coli]